MRPPQIHRCLTATIDEGFALASDADGQAISAALETLGGAALDEATCVFLRQAQRLLLDAMAALTSVLDVHRHTPYCHECGTAEICRTVRAIQEIFYGGSVTPTDGTEVRRSLPLSGSHGPAMRIEP